MTLAALGEAVSRVEWKRMLREWGWFAGAVFLAIYFGWAGSAADPRVGALWRFTDPVGIRGEGWFLLSPGLGHLLIGAAMLYALVSAKAYRIIGHGAGEEATLLAEGRALPVEDIESRHGKIVVAAILIGGMFVRVYAWGGSVPLQLSPAALGADAYSSPDAWRWPALFAELLTLGVLLMAQKQIGRTLWMVALYAFHPLAILAAASGAWQVWGALAAVVLGALAWRLKPWVARSILVIAAAGSVFCVWRMATHLDPASHDHAFDGLFAGRMVEMAIPRIHHPLLLTAIALLIQVLFLAVAFWRRWSLPRALTFVLLAWALTTPHLMPMDVLPLLALTMISWNAAVWVLSGTVFFVYGIVWSWLPGDAWVLPTSLTNVVIIPPLVVAFADWWRGIRTPAVSVQGT